MEDKIYVLKLGKYLYGGEKQMGNDIVSTLTDNLFEAKFHHDIVEVQKWQNKLGGKILQIEIKSHPVG